MLTSVVNAVIHMESGLNVVTDAFVAHWIRSCVVVSVQSAMIFSIGMQDKVSINVYFSWAVFNDKPEICEFCNPAMCCRIQLSCGKYISEWVVVSVNGKRVSIVKIVSKCSQMPHLRARNLSFPEWR